jgi:hypothetical protein
MKRDVKAIHTYAKAGLNPFRWPETAAFFEANDTKVIKACLGFVKRLATSRASNFAEAEAAGIIPPQNIPVLVAEPVSVAAPTPAPTPALVPAPAPVAVAVSVPDPAPVAVAVSVPDPAPVAVAVAVTVPDPATPAAATIAPPGSTPEPAPAASKHVSRETRSRARVHGSSRHKESAAAPAPASAPGPIPEAPGFGFGFSLGSTSWQAGGAADPWGGFADVGQPVPAPRLVGTTVVYDVNGEVEGDEYYAVKHDRGGLTDYARQRELSILRQEQLLNKRRDARLRGEPSGAVMGDAAHNARAPTLHSRFNAAQEAAATVNAAAFPYVPADAVDLGDSDSDLADADAHTGAGPGACAEAEVGVEVEEEVEVDTA